MKTVKTKKCRVCRKNFIPMQPMQAVCGIECGIADTDKKKAAAIEKREKANRKIQHAKDAQTRERLKTVSERAKETQAAVNKYIRLRDKGQPCISCGRPWKENFQAGHYVPQGRSSALRFDEDNIHGQCPQCNMYESGNLIPYRINLVQKIGLERVEWLESKRDVKRWSADELKALLAQYKEKVREIEQ